MSHPLEGLHDPNASLSQQSSTHVYREAASRGKAPSVSTVIAKAQPRELFHQKWWLAFHSSVWIIVSSICITMLYIKQKRIDEFYNHDSQCCYCLWAGDNRTVTNDYKVEWSPCEPRIKHLLSRNHFPWFNNDDPFTTTNASKVCNINGTTYCGDRNLAVWGNDPFSDHDSDQFSISSTFMLFYQFHKYYPYYGYISLVSVLIFVLLISCALRTEAKLSERLFIGNMMLTMICYYSYIKLYQYKLTTYPYNDDTDGDNDICPGNVPQFEQFKGPQCYQSVLAPSINSWILRANVGYLLLYLFYCVLDILRKTCSKCTGYKINKCTSFMGRRCCKHSPEVLLCYNKCRRILKFIVIMTTAIFLFASYLVLMHLVLVRGEFNIVAPLYGIDNVYEKIFIGFICNLLFLMVFDMFYWRSCRIKCRAVCYCQGVVDNKNQKTWAEFRGHTFSENYNGGRKSKSKSKSSVVKSYDVNNDIPYHRL